MVNSSDLLYVIDPRPYQAALEQAKGQLEQALAQQQLNKANLERAKDFLAKKTIAQQDFETTGVPKVCGRRSGCCQPSRGRVRPAQP